MSAVVYELLPWFRAVLDEDERLAWEATMGPWRRDGSMVVSKEGWVATAGSYADADYIVEHNPVQRLADVEADRKLLHEYEQAATAAKRAAALASDGLISEASEIVAGSYAEGLERAVELRAATRSGHPGYRDVWRPE